MTDAIRSSFEKHILDNFVAALEYGYLSLEKDEDGNYVHGDTNGWWMIYQQGYLAARVEYIQAEREKENNGD